MSIEAKWSDDYSTDDQGSCRDDESGADADLLGNESPNQRTESETGLKRQEIDG